MDKRQSSRNAELGLSTRAIHHGYDPAEEHGALTPPIFMTSTYAFETAEARSELFRGERAGYIYGRTRNPTQALLEARLASLEEGEAGLAVASGMGAISATMWTLLGAGDSVVIDRILYGNTFAFFTKGLTRFGVNVRLADFTDPDALAQALTADDKTKLVYFETPANPNLRIIDIARVSSLAKSAGALAIVDNTFATPILQNPLKLGVDLVIHSATKYLGGHGDLLGGAVVGPSALIEQIRGAGLRALTGATLSPLNAFLILRGLKTLEVRMERHSRSAQQIAEFIERHPLVSHVAYPGLKSFPQIRACATPDATVGRAHCVRARGRRRYSRRAILHRLSCHEIQTTCCLRRGRHGLHEPARASCARGHAARRRRNAAFNATLPA